MKVILSKISSVLRNLFALLRVTLILQIGRAKVSKDDLNTSDEEDHHRKESSNDSKSDRL